jgi:hypothetical protein
MAGWYPAIDTHRRAAKAAKMGVFAALGFAALIGIPTMMAISVGHVESGFISPVEVAIVGLLVGVALLSAWRFHQHRGSILGPVLVVALVIEVAKRIALSFQGTLSFSVFDAVFTFMIFFGLLNGIRGARALRHLPPDGDLEEIFE